MESESSETALRPNIRIEIKNNLVQSMDVDNDDNTEGEEGEIMDMSGTESTPITLPKPITIEGTREWVNEEAVFPSRIQIFDKNEQKKLLERAKRFQLDQKDKTIFGVENLVELYASLGVTAENEKDVRFEAIHMLGTDDMSTEEVLKYFGEYGPLGIEWISDDCCNIVWSDKESAAHALFFLSKPINGMPIGENSDPFDIDNEMIVENSLRNKHREIEMKEDDDEVNKENVNKNDIKITIPAGYWRAGQALLNSQYFLLRFAFKSDKKAYKAERFSYYKKGQPIFDGTKGLISASRKNQAKGIFDRNQEIIHEADSEKNPWGRLAENWYEDVKYAEPEYKPTILNRTKNTSSGSALQHRLGFKRAHKSEERQEETQEKEKSEKKSKVPRMRMYADEEEEKIKRKQKLKAMAVTTSVKLENDPDDLRNSLSKPSDRIKKAASSNVVDLGVKLKNRKLKQVLQIEEDYNKRMPLKFHSYDNNRISMEDMNNISRSRLNTKQLYMDKVESRKTSSRLSPKRSTQYESRHHRSRHHRISPARKHESDYEDDYDYQKTNSKVTVVIKKQRTPAVASTVYAPTHSDREKPKSVAVNQQDSSLSESSTDTSSSSSSLDSESDSEVTVKKNIARPGFTNNFKSPLFLNPSDLKSPLRIEINNDHFRN